MPDGPQLNDSSTYNVSTLQWCRSDIHSVETGLQILNFGLFPGLAIRSTRLSYVAEQDNTLPTSHRITSVNNRYIYKHSVPR